MRKYLKEIREKAGLSQLECANRLDISESYYNMIEAGKRMPDMSLSMMEKIADLFHVSVLFIADKEKSKP